MLLDINAVRLPIAQNRTIALVSIIRAIVTSTKSLFYNTKTYCGCGAGGVGRAQGVVAHGDVIFQGFATFG